ncbi:MAG: iron-containing alcohol dehydrogenase [Lachnospiraceae bacterium]|nr:iron-containing alcohol dehydrogenase [Lachnospiraceae bacterium]
MDNFNFLSPTRLIVGKNAELETGKWIKEYGGTTVLVHHDSGFVKQNGFVDKIISLLREEGLKVVELGGVVPNPHLSKVYEGIELCKKEHVDFLLAIGGGSVIDSTKAIAMGLPYEGDVWDFFVEEDGIPHDVPVKSTPLGVILTIAATGSEASNSCVITKADENLKRFCDNDINRAVFAIENPELTMTLPPFQTACGIIDIMSHSMERYFTPEKGNDILTDYLCEAIFHTCMDCGRILMKDPTNYEARASIMVASTLSHNGLTGMGRTGDWASHFIEHELSGEYFQVTHGAGLAVITPAWMKYVYKDNMTLFIKWATRVMGVTYDYSHPENTVLEAIDRLELFFQSLGVPTKLGDIPGVENLSEEVMEKMAKRVRVVHEDGSIGWVKRLHTKDIVEIFKLAI